MSSSRLLLRSASSRVYLQSCTLCQLRHISRHNGAARLSCQTREHAEAPKCTTLKRHFVTKRIDGPKTRANVDERARKSFYALGKQQGALLMEVDKANAIYTEFLAQKGRLDHGSNVRRLAQKYHVDLENITSLAMTTFKISDLSDPERRAQLPPSQHKPTSGYLLQGCAQAEEPLAIVHILTAVYLSSTSPDLGPREIAGLFPQSEIAKYRKTLEMLSQKAKTFALGPDVLTLQGLFLEKEGHRQKARALFEEALLRSHLRFTPGSRHPMQLPLITPWNALGYLLRADKNPAVQAQAKEYFLRGAREADDPLSCYECSIDESKTNPDWLQYTSRAAASGHRQATVNLAEFYQEVSVKNSPVLEHTPMRKALSWLLGWKRDSAATLAKEWLQAAANMGHKPAMLQLANHYEALGDSEQAKQQLRQLLEPPRSATQSEEWPQLVQLAKKRLAGV